VPGELSTAAPTAALSRTLIAAVRPTGFKENPCTSGPPLPKSRQFARAETVVWSCVRRRKQTDVIQSLAELPAPTVDRRCGSNGVSARVSPTPGADRLLVLARHRDARSWPGTGQRFAAQPALGKSPPAAAAGPPARIATGFSPFKEKLALSN